MVGNEPGTIALRNSEMDIQFGNQPKIWKNFQLPNFQLAIFEFALVEHVQFRESRIVML